ncbi:MAG: rhomboid family intramembrane serine protease [Planctomycetales bacterium]|nr:rhomboid family intramembrane serine protease [Planctomycetales bacterium]
MIQRGSRHRVSEEFHGVLMFIGLLWVVYIASWLVPSILTYGVRPGTLPGLIGVLTMPFLHAGIGHLLSNTIPLAVLLALLAGSRANSVAIVVSIVLVNGLLLWAFSLQRDANHVGASGLVYGLVSFLILSGFLEWRPLSLLVSVIVLVCFGLSTSTWGGMLPRQGISWDGHLFGAIAGGLVAYALTREGTREKTRGRGDQNS